MMYPFITVNDTTEIVHSDLLDGNRVKLYIERPDKTDGFHHATCYLPDYCWEDISGFSNEEIVRFQRLIKTVEFLIYGKVYKHEPVVTDRERKQTAQTTMRLMLDDYARNEGISFDEAKERFSVSVAYEALFDYETGLWKAGPDYLRNFWKRCEEDA